MRRIAVYYRVSTDKQDFESQKYAIDKWLSVNTPKTVYTFQDFAMSGMDSHRPALKQMLSFAHKRKIDAIVAFKLDRISRKAMVAIQICMTMEQLGVEFIFVEQPNFSSPGNPFRLTMLAMFAEFAQMERDNYIDRIKNGLAAAKARGVKFGPPLKVTQEKANEILKLRKTGLTIREISGTTKLSVGSIFRVINRETKSLVVNSNSLI